MLSDQPSPSSVLKAIRVQLHQDASLADEEAQQERVLSALIEALLTTDNGLSLAWTIQALSGTLPREYELAPLAEHPISAHDAWEVVRALRQHAQLAVAEPVFVKTHYG